MRLDDPPAPARRRPRRRARHAAAAAHRRRAQTAASGPGATADRVDARASRRRRASRRPRSTSITVARRSRPRSAIASARCRLIYSREESILGHARRAPSAARVPGAGRSGAAGQRRLALPLAVRGADRAAGRATLCPTAARDCSLLSSSTADPARLRRWRRDRRLRAGSSPCCRAASAARSGAHGCLHRRARLRAVARARGAARLLRHRARSLRAAPRGAGHGIESADHDAPWHDVGTPARYLDAVLDWAALEDPARERRASRMRRSGRPLEAERRARAEPSCSAARASGGRAGSIAR